MEAPQKMVTSQDILHLRSSTWQGSGSLKASKRNISWMFLIRPFLWGGGWRPWDLRHEFHSPPPAVSLPLPNNGIGTNWEEPGLCRDLQLRAEHLEIRHQHRQKKKSPDPTPKPLVKKWHADWGHKTTLYSWDWKPEGSCKKWRKSRFFGLHLQAVTSSKKWRVTCVTTGNTEVWDMLMTSV